MQRFARMLMFLALALACYVVGFSTGAMLVVGAAMVLELLFWIEMLGPRQPRRERSG